MQMYIQHYGLYLNGGQMSKLLYESNEWTFESLEKTWEEIDRVGKEVFELDYYPAQIEIITAEHMIDAYCSSAMPTMYSHWSFGKQFVKQYEAYKQGSSPLAYEVVINTNPTIAFCMEDNTMTMQTLVMAHAVCGHGSFFKNNYLFQEWTDPDAILDYLTFAKNYIADCEYKYGDAEVERLLDACHSIQYYGIDKYKRRTNIKQEEVETRSRQWRDFLQDAVDDTWDIDQIVDEERRIEKIITKLKEDRRTFPEENLLYFIEKYAPKLQTWEREILRIIRKISQYFYPQMQTQLMNEGWATFTHYNIMTHLHDQGRISDGSYLEFLKSHTNVTFQPEFDSPYYSGINVYALGFAIFKDLERICKNPDDEDRYWFPELAGEKDWKGALKDIVELYRDESFVLQYLSPKVIRQFNMFAIHDNSDAIYYKVSAIQDDDDILNIREKLSTQYSLTHKMPQIEITDVDFYGDRILQLKQHVINDRLLDHKKANNVLEYIEELWGYPVEVDLEIDD